MSGISAGRRNGTIGGMWLAAILIVLSVAAPARAQLQTGNLYGTVLDEQGSPLPGVTVTLNGPQGAPQVQVTNAQGEFRFLGLPPGSYQTMCELEGFSTLDYEGVVINVGRNRTIEVTLSATAEDVITVTGESPLLDERRTSTGMTVSQTELEKIPTARDPWAILEQTPGVLTDRINVGGNENGQESSFTSRGVPSSENVWSVDGVVITDMADVGKSPTYYDFDSFEEMDITTGGADPTIATGGVVMNIVTKRGTNEWRGSGRYDLSDEGWNSDFSEDVVNRPGSQFNQANRIVTVKDYGAELGGPIIKDRLWIWGSYGQQQIDLLTPSDVDSFRDLEHSHVKFNAQITPSNSATFLIFNNQKTANNVGADPARILPNTWWSESRDNTAYKIEDTHIFSSNFYLTGMYSKVNGGFDLVPQGGLDTPALFDDVNGSGLWRNSYEQFQTERPQQQYKLDGSYFFNTGNSSHELKYGAGFREQNTKSTEIWPARRIGTGGLTFLIADKHSRIDTSYTSYYAQDTLTLGNLTANIGLRYDKQSGSIEGSRSPHPTRPDLMPGSSYATQDAEFDWGSTAPRLGLTYALGGKRDTLLRFNYGKFYDQLFTNLIGFGAPAGLESFSGAHVFDGNVLLGFVPPLPSAPASRQPANDTDADLDAPVTDELLFGVEHALLPEFVVGLNLTSRHYQNTLAFRDLVAPANGGTGRPVTRPDYLLADRLTTIIDGTSYISDVFSINPALDLTGRQLLENSDREQEYKGASLVFNKRLANRWMLRGNFTWQDWTWFVPESEAIDPTATLQQPQDGRIVALPSDNLSNGNVYLNSHWSYSVQGLYQLAPDRPWGFNVATNVFGRQGYPFRPFRQLTRPDGSNANVDITQDDDLRLDDILMVDARVEKEFSFSDFGLSIGVDLFNVFNEQYTVQRNGSVNQGNIVREVTAPRAIRLGARVSFR